MHENVQIVEPTTTLYLKIPSLNSSEFNKVCDTLSQHSGDSDVIIVCEDTKKRIKAPDRLKIKPSKDIEDALAAILGQNNVKIVIK